MVVSAKGKAKKIRGQNEPKKPITEYFMFLNDERKNIPKNLSVKEQTAILSAKWKELAPERKEGYSRAYAEALSVYKGEMAKYKETDEYRVIMEQKKDAKKEEAKKNGKVKTVRKPTGYNLFVKEERAKLVKENPDNVPNLKEISQVISKKWQSLTDDAKEEYKAKAKEAGIQMDEASENRESLK
ncbi:hypothetical protein NECID01_1330 [Nematocida sp. AWRm77]|nr:hypothetical protein NECID01_1330 [Nematocida sp. AWRm77]